ncbi:MAG TPA: ABC transporter permease [Xanthobacteraceae bacterium]|jgi:capsular polysaccharide transport system permease protein|nr:ABC transporter permease [Xanthobacteraceae bacterium]
MAYDSEEPDFAAVATARFARRRESLWQIQRRIWLAVMLRDMRTRFFGNGLGFVVQVAWPATHVAILVLIHSLRSLVPPYGDSSVVFYTVGILPFLTFVYISRYSMLTLIWNSSLLAFPAVKPLDLLVGHIFLEVVNSFLVWILIMLALSVAGFDMMPRHVVDAFCAYGACVLLGCGFALFNGVIARIFKGWATGYVLIIICFYITSGSIVTPEDVPPMFEKLMVLNPIFHGVAWMRSAYYDGYGADLVEKWYILAWGAGTVLLGLAFERFARNRLLKST